MLSMTYRLVALQNNSIFVYDNTTHILANWERDSFFLLRFGTPVGRLITTSEDE